MAVALQVQSTFSCGLKKNFHSVRKHICKPHKTGCIGFCTQKSQKLSWGLGKPPASKSTEPEALNVEGGGGKKRHLVGIVIKLNFTNCWFYCTILNRNHKKCTRGIGSKRKDQKRFVIQILVSLQTGQNRENDVQNKQK